MLLKQTFCLLILSFLSFPIFAQGIIDSSEVVTLRIDPQNARGANVSQVFDEVKFIPLETTKESLFGTIAQLKTSENRLIIYDYDTHSILLFNNDGKYLSKINASKLQTEAKDKEKAQLYGFLISKEDGKEYIVIYTQNNFQYFTLDGTFVKKVKTPLMNTQTEFKKEKISLKQYSFIKNGKDSTYYRIMMMDKVKNDSIGYFPYDPKMWQKDEFYGSAGLNQYAPSEAFFSKFYDYNLYRVTPKKVTWSYKFILPVINTMPADFATNEKYFKKRFEFFRENRKVINGIGPCYQLGDDLFIKFESVGWDKDQKRNLIYNLKSGDLTSFQDLEPDSLSSFLPITDSGFGFDFENKGFLTFQDNKFYTSYSSLAMFSFKERSADKNIKYPPLLENYFKTSDRKSNPIIVVLKPKSK